MTPIELYEFLRSQYSDFEVDSICQTDKYCKRVGLCTDKQGHHVIDFDELKDTYYNKVTQKPASVDAVCVGNLQKYFCFVELKGWRNYMLHLKKQKRNIEETAKEYNLSGKLKDSQTLCIDLTSDKELFANMPVVFLLVTDIDVNKEGIENFNYNLNALASTSSDIYSECITESRRTLESEIRIQHDYVYCKDFDEHMKSL